MFQQKKRGEFRPYTFIIHIPARYEVRPSKATRVVWLLLSPVAVLLGGYCLLTALGAAALAGLWHVLFLFDGWRGPLLLLGPPGPSDGGRRDPDPPPLAAEGSDLYIL